MGLRAKQLIGDAVFRAALVLPGYVERMAGRHLPPENSCWTSEARRLLSDFLWNEGKAPAMRRLVLKSLAPDKLGAASRWRRS